MKVTKQYILLALVVGLGASVAPSVFYTYAYFNPEIIITQEIDKKESLKEVSAHNVRYVHDQRTGMCFVYSFDRNQIRDDVKTGITKIKCTKEVKQLADKLSKFRSKE